MIVNCYQLLNLKGRAKKTKRGEKKTLPFSSIAGSLKKTLHCFQGSFGINEALTNIFAAELALMEPLVLEGTCMQH